MPSHVRGKWIELASRKIELGVEPNFNDLHVFIQERAHVANTAYGLDFASESRASQNKQNHKPHTLGPINREKRVTLTTSTSEFSPASESHPRRENKLSCIHCKEQHKLIACEKFKLIPLDDKLRVIKKYGMCDNCLNFKHSAKYCRKNSLCTIRGLKGTRY